MSEPYIGKRVEITGTSRSDLNGKKGEAVAFDMDRGRYRVRVRGADLWLKPSNLLPAKDTAFPTNFAEAKDLAEEYAAEAAGRLKAALPQGVQESRVPPRDGRLPDADQT